MSLKRLAAACVVTLSLLYPVAVYFGLEHLGPAFFAALLCMAAITRYFLDCGRSAEQLAFLGVAAAYSLLLAISGSEVVLKLYPAVMSVSVGAVFFLSAFQPQSLIERLVRLRGGSITARAQGYMRKLTLIWAMLLFSNAAVALYLAAFGTMEQWAVFAGLLSYAAFAIFAGLEYAYRRYYISKYEHNGKDSE